MKLPSKIQELVEAEYWLKKDGVTCSLARWVYDLLPKDGVPFVENLCPLPVFLKRVALLGTLRSMEVRLGQVSIYEPQDTKPVIICFEGRLEATAMHNFGKICYLNVPAAILRTAIMMGLELPLVELGVMSPTRSAPFTLKEMRIMWL